MSGAYDREIRWRFNSEAAKRYFNRGRKLVGEVVARILRGDGLKQSARTITLDDGTTIRVIMDGSVPIVEIIASDNRTISESGESCEMYMESGQLYLSSSIANLSTTQEPYLTFNTRTAYNAKYNGTIRVSRVGKTFTVASAGALSEYGDSTACNEVRDPVDNSVLATRAAKKTAQYLVPASCFTGLMRRWVQAQYGTPGAVYGSVNGTRYPSWALSSSTTPKLQVRTAQLDEDGNTVFGSLNLDFRRYHCCGIVDPTRQLDFWFVSIWPYAAHGGQQIEFRKANLTDCGKLLRYYLLAIGRAHPDYQKLSTFLMSQLTPESDVAVARALPSEILPAMGPYGWKFNGSGTVAAIVSMTVEEPHDETYNGYTYNDIVRAADYVVHQLAFSINDDDGLPDFTLSSSAPVTGWVDQFYDSPRVLYPLEAFKRHGVNLSGVTTFYNLTSFANDTYNGFNTFGTVTAVFDYDAPVYCWFEDDTLALVRYQYASVAASSGIVDSGCPTSPRNADVVEDAGDNTACPCTASCYDGLVCDSATDEWVRVARTGFYTSYASNVGLTTQYPYYDVDYENDGIAGVGDLSTGHASQGVTFADDVYSSTVQGGPGSCSNSYLSGLNPVQCNGTGIIFDTVCAAATYSHDVCSATFPTCANGGTVTTETWSKRRTLKTTSGRYGDGARDTAMHIPSYDASSAFFRTFTYQMGSGSNAVSTGTMNIPYRFKYTLAGEAYVESGGTASCSSGESAYKVYVRSCEVDSYRALCWNASPQYGSNSRLWNVNGSGSTASYSWYIEVMTSELVARGTTSQVDDLYAAGNSVTGTASHPPCYVRWDPQTPIATSPVYIYSGGTTRYVVSNRSWNGSSFYSYLRVWQSDGGDFVHTESLRRSGEQESFFQASGYEDDKVNELFSFIGWA